MTFDPFVMAGFVVTALVSAGLGLMVLSALAGRQRTGTLGIFAETPGTSTFLFDGETLVDATPGARAILRHSPMRSGSHWSRLMAWLHPRFPGAAEALLRLPSEGRAILHGAEGQMLTAELRGGLTRLTLAEDGADRAEPMADRAMHEEVDLLRRAVTAAPLAIWREDAAGEVTWGNSGYLDLALRHLPPGSELDWPLPRLFERTASVQGARNQRQKLTESGGGETRWFDLCGFPEGDGRLVFALPADTAVQAETSLRAFMQTLTKTFAHLRTGLAIFDDARHLQLFNPALTDLTGLPPDLLSARPTLAAFLDAMRERSMIPEPRDYRSWRREMTELEVAAASGLYEEVWNLPSGQAYRVTARPHPNGALALMIEDISTEVTRSRRYRADVELGQSVIDAMDEAIAVFSQSGTLVMSNTAYAAMWDHDPGGTLDGAVAAATLCDHWRERTAPTTVWDRTEDFVAALGPLNGWTDEAYMQDGRRITLRLARLGGGATLVMFRDTAAPGLMAAAPTESVPHFATARKTA